MYIFVRTFCLNVRWKQLKFYNFFLWKKYCLYNLRIQVKMLVSKQHQLKYSPQEKLLPFEKHLDLPSLLGFSVLLALGFPVKLGSPAAWLETAPSSAVGRGGCPKKLALPFVWPSKWHWISRALCGRPSFVGAKVVCCFSCQSRGP